MEVKHLIGAGIRQIRKGSKWNDDVISPADLKAGSVPYSNYECM
jgi:hypothetical protein